MKMDPTGGTCPPLGGAWIIGGALYRAYGVAVHTCAD
jgi:hypothetical protein